MPPTKIAIIGSGMAGLAAAYALSRQSDVRITLLERSASLGMDCHRVDREMEATPVSIDVPSRMFNTTQWPTLVDLYDQIGVAYDAVDASQSFTKRSITSDQQDDTYLEFDVAFRPDLALRRMLNTKSRRLLSEATRLMKQGRSDLDAGIDHALTLGQYLADRGYEPSFKTLFLYATLSSTVCTCSYADLDRYPAHIILETLRRLTDDRALMRTRYGTRDVVQRLAGSLDDIRLNNAVVRVVDDGQQVCIVSADGSVDKFDHVIVATQANTAIRLQPEISAREHNILASIPYADVDVIVHTDQSLMPSRRSSWRTFNMIVCESPAGHEIGAAMCTVWLNRFDANLPAKTDLFQTIGPVVQPESSKIVARVKLQRPSVNARSAAGVAMLNEMHDQLDRRVWYCGSWAAPGVPLLESAVISAQKVTTSVLQARNVTC